MSRTMVRCIPSQRRPWHRFALLAALCTACVDNSVTDTEPVASVALTPTTATLETGRTLALAATPRDAGGATIPGRSIAWSSSNPAVATVSTAGVVTARAVGDASIAASAGGQSALATITVTIREVASVQVTPVALAVRVGRTASLVANVLDAEGSALTGRPVAWSSSNDSVVRVDAQGVITAVSPGAAEITVSSGSRSAQAAVTVTPEPVASVTLSPTRDTLIVGASRSLRATLRDANDNVITGRPVSWSVNDVSVATVSSTGEVTTLAPGTVTVSAVSEGRAAQATIVVLARIADGVTLTPTTATLQLGATLTLLAQVTDPDGTLLPDRLVSFSSDAPAIASVSTTGVVTARAPGTVRITASSEGRSALATIVVIPVTVAQVNVLPVALDVLQGASRQLAAEARSASGALLAGRVVTWTSGASGVASIAANGVLNAESPGIATIAATIEGVTGFATVTVRARVVTSVVVQPASPTIDVGGTVQLTATVRDQSGTLLPDRQIVWTSSNENIAFVSSTGLVIGGGAGSATITATVEGVSASTFVTVR